MDYHKDRFEDYSLMIFEGNELLAILPANKKENILFSHKGLTYGGLIYNSKLRFETVFNCFYSLLKYLKVSGFVELVIKLLPRIYESQPNDELTLILHIAKASIERADGLSVINLQNEFIISRDRKQGIKRGESNSLVVKEETDFDKFWNTILIPNLQKKHSVLPVHSLAEMTDLRKNFSQNIRQFNVYHNDELIAGATVFESKYVAHMQYISGNELKNELGSIDFLHHHLISDVFKDKRYFDFGHSSINSGDAINESLLYWKEGFGGRMVQHPTYRIKTANYKYLENYLQ